MGEQIGMTLESLGNFIRQPDNENSFHRIYRAHLLQEKMVELLGGKCSLCNYSKCINSLEFHHKNKENQVQF